METVIIVIHLMVIVALVAVVLMQRSEGGALGIGGGGQLSFDPQPGQRADARHGHPGGRLLCHLAGADAARPLPGEAVVDPRHRARSRHERPCGAWRWHDLRRNRRRRDGDAPTPAAAASSTSSRALGRSRRAGCRGRGRLGSRGPDDLRRGRHACGAGSGRARTNPRRRRRPHLAVGRWLRQGPAGARKSAGSSAYARSP